MKNLFNSRNLYKLIVIIFILFTVVKIRNQMVILNSYNKEIADLEGKIAVLEEKNEKNVVNSGNSRKDNENIARKDLKMYYPNETPYKGY